MINQTEVRDHIERQSNDPLRRVKIAVAERSRILGVMDDVIEHLVSNAREEGYSWAEILGETEDPSSPSASANSQGLAGSDVRDHQGKYRALWKWLQTQTADQVDLTFAEIEGIIGFDLPGSSREHMPPWYGYKGSAVARAIIDAGFKAKNVDLHRETVTLARVGAPEQ